LLGDLSENESDKDDNEITEKLESEKKKKGSKDKSAKKPLFQDKGDNNPFKTSSLFSGGSLFSNLENKSDSKGLFSSSLSKTLANSSLFSGSSLFANIGNSNSNFLNKNNNKAEDLSGDDNDDNENEDDILKPSNSPKPYDPVNNTNSDKNSIKSIYAKRYVKEIESLYELVKEEKITEKKEELKEEKKIEYVNKYVNKGKGYLSLEYTEEGQKTGIIVYR
jgi:hypothetical protein